MAKETYRVQSFNGVTQGPYPSRAAAQRAADKANEIAPEQRWRPVPEAEYSHR